MKKPLERKGPIYSAYRAWQAAQKLELKRKKKSLKSRKYYCKKMGLPVPAQPTLARAVGQRQATVGQQL
jgi:hypothetical protein